VYYSGRIRAAGLRAWHDQLQFAELINLTARLDAEKFGPL
jgi:hypothetical protein